MDIPTPPLAVEGTSPISVDTSGGVATVSIAEDAFVSAIYASSPLEVTGDSDTPNIGITASPFNPSVGNAVTLSTVPFSFYYEIDHADLASATSDNVVLWTPPDGTIILGYAITIPETFASGTLAGVSIVASKSGAAFTSALGGGGVFPTIGDSLAGANSSGLANTLMYWDGTDTFRADFTAFGGDLDELSAGKARIGFVACRMLPANS